MWLFYSLRAQWPLVVFIILIPFIKLEPWKGMVRGRCWTVPACQLTASRTPCRLTFTGMAAGAPLALGRTGGWHVGQRVGCATPALIQLHCAQAGGGDDLLPSPVAILVKRKGIAASLAHRPGCSTWQLGEGGVACGSAIWPIRAALLQFNPDAAPSGEVA